MARARFLRRVLRAIGREIGEGAFSSAAATRLVTAALEAASRGPSSPPPERANGYPVPPGEMTNWVGISQSLDADSWKIAIDDSYRHFVSMLGGVNPEWCVLEPGCGCGRLALSIAPRVRSYIGFDVNRSLVGWCRENIPEGKFHHVDAKNEMYNPGGSATIRFPCEDSTVDLIYMSSVVTHLRRGDFEEFLREGARCLKPGGRMLFSCYLQSSAMQGRDTVPVDDIWTKSVSHILDEVSWVDDPISNTFVVYDGDWITLFADSLGFHHVKTAPGSWGGLEAEGVPLYGQDWLLLRKH